MLIVTYMYGSGKLAGIPCDNDIVSNTIRNFIHTDTGHIAANLSVFYILSMEIEKSMSPTNYMILLLSVTGLIVVMETIYLNVYEAANCSIGFSGILYGLLIWDILTEHTITTKALASIAILVIEPSLTAANISFSGHAIGALSGLIVYFIAKKNVSTLRHTINKKSRVLS